METEQWKSIPGYEGYEVSDQGRVRSYHKILGKKGQCILDTPQRILKPYDRKGYKQVSLVKDGKRYQIVTCSTCIEEDERKAAIEEQ